MSFFSRQGLGHGSSIGMAAGIGAMMYGMNRLSNSSNQTQASVGLGFMGVGAVGAAVGAGFNPALRGAMSRAIKSGSSHAAESKGVSWSEGGQCPALRLLPRSAMPTSLPR